MSMPVIDRVAISIEKHVATVQLNRAEKMNALDMKMFSALAEAADSLAGDASVRAVVIHGAGGNFCAGIDVSVMGGGELDFGEALSTPLAPSPANFFQRAAYAWRELPVPVICALEGVVFGGGLQVALGADIRIASPDARFSIMESKWGLIPDMALTTTLRGLVAPDKVKELAWTARILDSAEAKELGLVTTVVDDPLAAAQILAAECAARSPDAIRGIKALVNQAWQLSEAESLALEARLQSGIIGGANQTEAIAANLQKRKPAFKD
jgi:enoyl-CoA hydratase/carnithine racemase